MHKNNLSIFSHVLLIHKTITIIMFGITVLGNIADGFAKTVKISIIQVWNTIEIDLNQTFQKK